MVDGQRSVAGHGRCLCLSILFMLSAALHLALLLWPLIHPSSYYGFPNTNNLIAEGLFVEHDIRFRPSLALVPLLPSITLIRVSITFIMGIVLLVFGNSIKLNNFVVHQWICHGHTQLYIVSPHGYNCACTLLFTYVIRLNTLFHQTCSWHLKVEDQTAPCTQLSGSHDIHTLFMEDIDPSIPSQTNLTCWWGVESNHSFMYASTASQCKKDMLMSINFSHSKVLM